MRPQEAYATELQSWVVDLNADHSKKRADAVAAEAAKATALVEKARRECDEQLARMQAKLDAMRGESAADPALQC